jgi:hypothetical protein
LCDSQQVAASTQYSIDCLVDAFYKPQSGLDTMSDDGGEIAGDSTFPFSGLDYVPFGFSSDTAPYIETPIATMRAAATLMRLDGSLDVSDEETNDKSEAKIVVCDLGCGDGDMRNCHIDFHF